MFSLRSRAGYVTYREVRTHSKQILHFDSRKSLQIP
ncbi:hypothetical protein ASD8599_02589 [Ascidiaceihabitans donghaensis]|uniref:Uncharacterized protein n=1 Tax=Ascidiaceihabitans donghaensis TaxID=1510460 RepID=A0A2R8BFQ3_9RHOB|nr:hypothetical protein ASD8599_02589 [Ascidiaceihabitans donghaensis]